MADPTPTPAPVAPPSIETRLEEALSAAFKEQGLVKETPAAPVVGAKEEAKKEAPAPTPEAVKPPVEETRLAKLARESAALRKAKQEQAQQPLAELNPGQAAALQKALASKDPASALAALGFTHSEYEEAVIQRRPSAPVQEEDPDYKGLPPKVIAELKETREKLAIVEKERAQYMRNTFLGQVKSQVEKIAEKYPLVAKLDQVESIEAIMKNYWNATGKYLGDTFEESVEIAAEQIQADLEKEAAKWRKVLTIEQQASNVPGTKAPESPSAGSVKPREQQKAAPAANEEPVRFDPSKAREERLAALLKDPNFLT